MTWALGVGSYNDNPLNTERSSERGESERARERESERAREERLKKRERVDAKEGVTVGVCVLPCLIPTFLYVIRRMAEMESPR